MNNTASISNPVVILRLKEVVARTAISRSTIYGKLDSKSTQYDPDFPTPLKLGRLSVGWVESELNSWIQAKIENRNLEQEQTHE